MLRVIVREVYTGEAANVGGPVGISHKTFDVNPGADEQTLRKQVQAVDQHLRARESWVTREVVGVEVLP